MILIGLGTAWLLRHSRLAYGVSGQGSWQDRWQQTLKQFVLPPLVLFMTAIAVVCMGRQGWMVFGAEGWLYVWVSIGYLAAIALLLFHLSWQSYQMQQRLVGQFPPGKANGQPYRLLQTSALYSAQIGLWRPQLVISQGLLDHLTPEQLEAVLLHEQAHCQYRDTFWFFWLGWLRRCTRWLPQTEALWQELLLLRELRADRWATSQTDPLLLAEALVQVVRSPVDFPAEYAAAFGAGERDRLTERIEAMLAEPIVEPTQPTYTWLLWGLLPLLLIPLHC
ncbi:MAG: M56 family metallopeptidase [Cyanobacteria bacterium P01_G01_bin.54]